MHRGGEQSAWHRANVQQLMRPQLTYLTPVYGLHMCPLTLRTPFGGIIVLILK